MNAAFENVTYSYSCYKEFYGHSAQLSTFLESCGVADLITTCYGGRNRKVSEAFVKTGKVILQESFSSTITNSLFNSHVFYIFVQSIEVLEKEMLNGQRLQGPMTAAEVNHMLKLRGLEDK
jgi:glycerol-3-phosphate dehydrogenase (NAD+)